MYTIMLCIYNNVYAQQEKRCAADHIIFLMRDENRVGNELRYVPFRIGFRLVPIPFDLRTGIAFRLPFPTFPLTVSERFRLTVTCTWGRRTKNATPTTRCQGQLVREGDFETASPLEKKKKHLFVNNNYLKMYRNIFIFIESTRAL
jgi:hypothetical protein